MTLPDRLLAAAPARTTRGLALADAAPALAPAVARSAADLFAMLPPAAEQRLLALLAAPWKEGDLCAVLVGLTVIEARGLHYRLSARREGDALAAAFARLAFARRARLLDFLADARRRDARAHR